ncbi:exodeoxyribonuclease VII small subunit [Patulibacter sp. SYSU D01012]|uniref:exodeoxyribonuclease VII small subunit n=1 Tax=Patulibacter sp. SYSU D01012 TaxID=2817381 RepID=UPI001B3185DC|nr:exodeoxyribonuclease VII small subunit [Patulibacter sp. SYSU D01012]
MSPETDAPVELSFGAAYERLQQVAAELGADAAMAPERLIALLREGKGLERALREHLDRIEQEVRAIDEGEGAARFRIVDGAPSGAPDAPSGAGVGASNGVSGVPTAPPGDGLFGEDPPPSGPRRRDGPPAGAPPTLGFGDDDLPF